MYSIFLYLYEYYYIIMMKWRDQTKEHRFSMIHKAVRFYASAVCFSDSAAWFHGFQIKMIEFAYYWYFWGVFYEIIAEMWLDREAALLTEMLNLSAGCKLIDLSLRLNHHIIEWGEQQIDNCLLRTLMVKNRDNANTRECLDQIASQLMLDNDQRL